MTILFFSRLFLYLLAFSLPFINPAIVVPYDKVSALLWFGLVPVEMAIAYFLAPPRFRLRTWLGAAVAAIVLTVVLVPGFDSFWLILIAGVLSFALTTFVFHIGARTRAFFVLEQFFLALIYYRMLSFSQASQDVARETSGLTQIIMATAIVAFFVHGLVLYLTSARATGVAKIGDGGQVAGGKRARQEVAVYLAVGLPLLLAVAFLIPPNFVTHTVVANLLNGQVHPKPIPLDQTGRGWPGNGSLNNRDQYDPFGLNGRQFGNRPGNGDPNGTGPNGQGSLEGVPADQWQNPGQGQGKASGKGQSSQRAVMIVESTHSPVYAADAYFDTLDPVKGFIKSSTDPLNDLTQLRLLGTWKNPVQNNDVGRMPWTVHFFSTISSRVVPYLPDSIDPTVFKGAYYPFSYFYDSVSQVTIPDVQSWGNLGALSPEEKLALKDYLSVPFTAAERKPFQTFLDAQLRGTTSYFGRIMAILKGFSTYQYQIGISDDVTVAHMEKFLTQTKDGDCTEFSNTAAILGRLAGIPSRVVTGYLASRSLQTAAHVRGTYILQQSIPELQKYPLKDLFLVTTSHRHSWVQYYLPEYGWVDFESTAFALPPPPGQNPNNMRVVIPLIQPQKEQAPIFRFPWLLVLQLFALLIVGIVALLYIFRYSREGALLLMARRKGRRGAWALYRVLLMQLAAAGYHLKPPTRTPVEYSEQHPEVRDFATAYTRLRYREQSTEGEQQNMWDELNHGYRSAIHTSRKNGLKERMRRIFSLRGLYY